MTHRRTLAAAALLVLAPAAGHAQRPTGDSAAAVDRLFARYTGDVPGCAVAVARDGRTILARAYGMTDLEHDVPNTTESRFEAGSVSKQFTAASIVLLAQQGKLSLDDDARKYVPELPDFGTPITIRHLLTHTSGLRDWGVVEGVAGWPRGTRVYTHAHVLDLVSRQKKLNYRPGDEYSYTNTGYNLLAIIVERVGGLSLPEFTRRYLFEPIGMMHTGWRDDFTRVVKGRALAYAPRDGGGFSLDMPFEDVYGNAALLTTVGDLLLWNENLNTGRVGGAAFVEEMQRQFRLNGGRQIEYAAGLFVTSYKGLREISHTGATAGYRAFLARIPDPKLSVALLCNRGDANPGRLGHQVVDVFLGGAAKAAPPPPAIALPPAKLAAFAGLYRDTRTQEPLRLTVADGKLRAERAGELIPVSPTSFRPAEGDERIVVRPAPNGGRPTLLRLTADGDTVRYEPVDAVAPTAAELAAYAGDYYSDEAEVTYTVAVEDGKLVLRGRPDWSVPLEPVYRDAFTSRRGLLRFSRDAAGRITGFGLWLPRVRDMRFERAGG
ncbi:MAG: serine hydrolase [Gemmatimonadetes bacterium]|nr:serine hydrolase [Gemmatimonadota bacterium]